MCVDVNCCAGLERWHGNVETRSSMENTNRLLYIHICAFVGCSEIVMQYGTCAKVITIRKSVFYL